MMTTGVSAPITSQATLAPGASATISLVRLWVALAFERKHGDPMLRSYLLDTGAPVCVIPYSIHRSWALKWADLLGPWPQGLLEWFGVPCSLGRVEAWLPTPRPDSTGLVLSGPFAFVAKLPQSTPPALVGKSIPIILGLNFFAEHRAHLAFQCYRTPDAGSFTL